MTNTTTTTNDLSLHRKSSIESVQCQSPGTNGTMGHDRNDKASARYDPTALLTHYPLYLFVSHLHTLIYFNALSCNFTLLILLAHTNIWLARTNFWLAHTIPQWVSKKLSRLISPWKNTPFKRKYNNGWWLGNTFFIIPSTHLYNSVKIPTLYLLGCNYMEKHYPISSTTFLSSPTLTSCTFSHQYPSQFTYPFLSTHLLSSPTRTAAFKKLSTELDGLLKKLWFQGGL